MSSERPPAHSPSAFGGRSCDVVVVGGGPVGGHTARLLAERGHDVLLVEEHRKVGEPVQCAGLFTPRIFDLVPFPVSDVHLNDIRGANVRSPGGKVVSLDGGKVMAVAIDRAGFDRRCVEAAAEAGAEVRTGVRAVRAERDAGGVTVTLRDGESVRARAVVGADGVQSQVARWFDLPRAKEVVPCYGAEVEGLRLSSDKVEMFVGQEQAPGFFSWMIPTRPDGTRGKVEVGVSFKAPHAARHYYERMYTDPLSKVFIDDPKVCCEICGCIPLGPLKATSAERAMLVGDAAAQAKPTSGGGVYTGLKCAGHLVDVLSDALEEDDLGAPRMAEYHRRWSDELGFELSVGMRLRKAFMHLSDDQVDRLFEILDDKELLGMVNALGDIDYPSKLAKALLKKTPQLFQFSGPVVKSLFTAA